MKRESRMLLAKAQDSLVLAVELFNRPSEAGRVCSVLILLDHAFEMLLKASIVQRGGRIREPKAAETIGFDACVRKAFSDGPLRFLNDEQVLTLQALNGLRDAAQHHLVQICEGQLYLYAQAAVTLFKDLLELVFGSRLSDHLPARVLPLSTVVPADIHTLFENEVQEISKLLRPGRRRSVEATARLRPLAIVNGALTGIKTQPSDSELQRLGRKVQQGADWQSVFPGVATIQLTADGVGPALSLRLTKTQGIPVHLVPEGTPGATVVAVKRVNELDFYNHNLTTLSELVGLTTSKTLAMVAYLGLSSDPDCFKVIAIGKARHKRYSQRAASAIREALKTVDPQKAWNLYHYGSEERPIAKARE